MTVGLDIASSLGPIVVTFVDQSHGRKTYLVRLWMHVTT